MARVQHNESGLYCESGLGPHGREIHIFLARDDTIPLQICKSTLELAAFLGGYTKAVEQYLPTIIAAVSLAPKNSPCYRLLDDFIYRHEMKSKYTIEPEPELQYEK